MPNCKNCGSPHDNAGGFCSDRCRDEAHERLLEAQRQKRQAQSLATGRSKLLRLLIGAVFATLVAVGVTVWATEGPSARAPRMAVVTLSAILAYRGYSWAIHAFRVIVVVGALLAGAHGFALLLSDAAPGFVVLLSAVALSVIAVKLLTSRDVLAFLASQRSSRSGSVEADLERRAVAATGSAALQAERALERAKTLPQRLPGFRTRVSELRARPVAGSIYVVAVFVHALTLTLHWILSFLSRMDLKWPYTPSTSFTFLSSRGLLLVVAVVLAVPFALRGMSYARAALVATSGWMGWSTCRSVLHTLAVEDYPEELHPYPLGFYWVVLLSVCSVASSLAMMAGRARPRPAESALDAQLRAGIGFLLGCGLAVVLGRPPLDACRASYTPSAGPPIVPCSSYSAGSCPSGSGCRRQSY